MSRTRNYRQLQDASELLWEKLSMLSTAQRAVFDERVMMSWIFHDFAIEGTVLQLAEIKAAIDDDIISSPALIPAYNHIIGLRDGINSLAATRGTEQSYNLDWLKRLHYLLLPTDKKDQTQYRKDNPIHRLYFHDLAAADKISYRMRKLTDWLRADDTRRLHPIELAAGIHREVIRIFPWIEISGRVARLAMNHVLVAEGLWPALIHHVDRQRYYDALRNDQDDLLELILAAVQQGLGASNRLYQQILDTTRHR